ncbi:MAG: formylglycine-generating enzyme family protein [Gemmataceae bacterium]|nr:formylglycine-generating enzyme family protein [Gemmataceae bacterium]
MTHVETLLAALADAPGDELAWLALADALEEAGEPLRAELLRCTRTMMSLKRRARGRRAAEDRAQRLLRDGVRPCWPQITNSVGMPFALVPPGAWVVGSPAAEADRLDHEPLKEAVIDRPLWFGVFPVTQRQHEALMGADPSAYDGPGALDCPADSMTWPQARGFCRKLGRLPEEKKAGRRYRLPDEDEWEAACRAGTSTPWCFGKALTPALACYDEQPDRHPCPVGRYPPNPWGLHDMHGNVWEKCVCVPRPDEDDDLAEALRGGSFRDPTDGCRSAFRTHTGFVRTTDDDVGFRVVMERG